jgi:hypothetical protein
MLAVLKESRAALLYQKCATFTCTGDHVQYVVQVVRKKLLAHAIVRATNQFQMVRPSTTQSVTIKLTDFVLTTRSEKNPQQQVLQV